MCVSVFSFCGGGFTMHRKGLLCTASVLLALASMALLPARATWAQDTTPPDNNPSGGSGDQMAPSDQNPPAETPPAENAPPAETPPPPRTPLMNLFDRVGIGPTMDHLGLNLHGYVEGGYLYDLTNPSNVTPPATAPGDDIFFAGPYKSQAILDQVDLSFERDIDPTKGNFDVGFKVSAIYGRDAYFTHSNGILDQDNKAGGGTGQENQLDIPEGHVDVAIPVLGGMLLQAGKFPDLFGVEKIDPTQNLFYTHSYAFSYGMPFTQTGVLGKIYTTPSETDPDNYSWIGGGVTRGWNQSFDDNNGAPDGVFYMGQNFTGGEVAFKLNFGPEGVLPYGPADNGDWWALPEVFGTYKFSDALTLSGDAFIGTAQKLSTWGGFTIYGDYVVTPRLAVNGRFEYYHDGHGVTTGVGGTDVDYGEVTGGVTITPMPDNEWLQFLSLRPELRYDWASRKVYDGTTNNQLTAAIDVIYKF
jgi:hypothetical protein